MIPVVTAIVRGCIGGVDAEFSGVAAATNDIAGGSNNFPAGTCGLIAEFSAKLGQANFTSSNPAVFCITPAGIIRYSAGTRLIAAEMSALHDGLSG